jgi:hypothetical protein
VVDVESRCDVMRVDCLGDLEVIQTWWIDPWYFLSIEDVGA